MNRCCGCDKEIAKDEFIIFINLKEDEFYTIYTFCSNKCKKEVYEDTLEGGEPKVPYVERRYNE